MEGKTGRTKGKENTCRTVGITKALADSGHSAARKGFFYFFALKFGYSIETKNPNASPIRKVFGLFVCGRSDRIQTCGLMVPNRTTSVFCLILRAFSCRKVHKSHVVQTCKWSRLWSDLKCMIYLFSIIHSSRSSYFISPEATESPTRTTSSTEGRILIPFVSRNVKSTYIPIRLFPSTNA